MNIEKNYGNEEFALYEPMRKCPILYSTCIFKIFKKTRMPRSIIAYAPVASLKLHLEKIQSPN